MADSWEDEADDWEAEADRLEGLRLNEVDESRFAGEDEGVQDTWEDDVPARQVRLLSFPEPGELSIAAQCNLTSYQSKQVERLKICRQITRFFWMAIAKDFGQAWVYGSKLLWEPKSFVPLAILI
jgi:hypothetical protein